MQISKISANTFGLIFKDNAMEFFERKYKNNPKKLLEVDRVVATYPKNIEIDIIKKDIYDSGKKSNVEKIFWQINDKIEKSDIEFDFNETDDILTIERLLKYYKGYK